MSRMNVIGVDAVKNTKTLFNAAKKAEVKRIVHVSITNPSIDSHLEYFSGKARVEGILKQTGISYAILRPAVLFGKEDILINNIAWALRHLPLFPVFGDGQYKLQPIYVDDLADLAVMHGESTEKITINTIGPETFTYKQLVQILSTILRKNRPIISVPPTLGYFGTWIFSKGLNDIILTRDEIVALMNNLLYIDTPPLGKN